MMIEQYFTFRNAIFTIFITIAVSLVVRILLEYIKNRCADLLPKQRNRIFIKIAVALICAVLVLVLFHDRPVNKDPLGAQTAFCKGNLTGKENDPNVTRLITRGIDKDRYFIEEPWRSIPLSQISIDKLSEWRMKAFKEMIEDHFKHAQNDRWYANIDFSPLFSNESGLHSDLINKKGFIAWVITIKEQEAYVDCQTQTYKYRLVFAIPRNSLMIFPEKIRSVITEHLSELYDEKLRQLASNNAIRINLYDDIFLEMFRNEKFKKAIMDEFKVLSINLSDVVEFIDVPLRDFFYNILNQRTIIKSFNRGEYKLSSDMTLFLDIFTNRFLKLRDRFRRYTITCEGYADSSPIKQAIPYGGKADITLESHRKEDFHDSNSLLGSQYITHNLALSIARGFEGARVISNILDSKLIGEERRSIKVFYSGGDEIPGPPLSAYRKIELHISKSNQ